MEGVVRHASGSSGVATIGNPRRKIGILMLHPAILIDSRQVAVSLHASTQSDE